MPRPGPSGSRQASTIPTTRCGRACSVTTRLLSRDLARTWSSFPTRPCSAAPTASIAYVVDDRRPRPSCATLKVGRIEDGMRGGRGRGLTPGERVVTSGHYRVQPGGPGRGPSTARSGAPAVASDQRDKRRLSMNSHEHLRPLHQYPDRDLADHGRHPVRRPGRLSRACRSRRCRRSTFPTIQVSAQLPGASPETMASSVAQPLERQFAQIPGVSQMTSTSGARRDHDRGAVRSRPQHRRRRQRHPGGHQRRQRPAAARSAGAADLSQGQPGRLADPDPVGDTRTPCR